MSTATLGNETDIPICTYCDGWVTTPRGPAIDDPVLGRYHLEPIGETPAEFHAAGHCSPDLEPPLHRGGPR